MKCVPSTQLLLALPGFLGTTRAAAHVSILGCCCFGAEAPSWSDQILALADGAAARMASTWDAVTRWPGQAAGDAASWARGQFIAAARDFQTAAIQAGQAGLTAASQALTELADRASQAAAKVATNMGDAFQNFWGFEPGDLPKFGAFVAVLLLVGAFALAWSPGGQGAIVALGRSAPGIARGIGGAARAGMFL